MAVLHLRADQLIAAGVLAAIFVVPPLTALLTRSFWGIEVSRRLWSAALTWFYLVVFVLSCFSAIYGSVLIPGFYLFGIPFVAAVLLVAKTTKMAAGGSTGVFSSSSK